MILIIAGLADASYLALSELNGVPLLCPSSGFVNCAAVISSVYANVFGIPLAYAVLSWFVIALLLFLAARAVKVLKNVCDFWYLVGIGGTLYSLVSMYAIREICVYCLVLDAILILIFSLTVYKLK